jgi:hypothetical protein
MKRILVRPAAIVATAAVVLLAAACGGGSSAGSSGSSNAGGSANPSLLAFSRCMRSNGVPHYADPDPGTSNAKVPSAQELGVSSTQLQAAENACEHLLPPGAGDRFPPAEVQLLLPGMRRFSQCMRAHGEPNFPDPTTDSQGRPEFPVSDAGLSHDQTRSPQFDAAMQACERAMPPQLGGVPLG